MSNDLAAPVAAIAARLVEAAAGRDVIHIAAGEARTAQLAAAACLLAPATLQVTALPGWDCLPFDRTGPSAESMGARMLALARLVAPHEGPRLLIASVDAAGQRLPASAPTGLALVTGDALDHREFVGLLTALGYREEDIVHAPGEFCCHADVIDVFPAVDSLPVRLHVRQGRVATLHRFDPLSQRQAGADACCRITTAAELSLDGNAALVSVFDLLPRASLSLESEIGELRALRLAEIADGRRLQATLPAAADAPLVAAEALYLDASAWDDASSGRTLALAGDGIDLPRFDEAEDPEAEAAAWIVAALARKCRVALAGDDERLAALLALLPAPASLASWPELAGGEPGTLGRLPAGQAVRIAGFARTDAALVTADDLHPPPRRRVNEALPTGIAGAGLRPGDAVIHLDYGVGALRGIETVAVNGARTDCLRLEFAGAATRLVPLDELDRLWRYGADADSVSLDHPGGKTWLKRRIEVQSGIAATGRALAAEADRRRSAAAPRLVAADSAIDDRYRTLCRRFAYSLSADQESAIHAVTADLASGHPMDRLICGDVGFGKTEVAVRAAGLAAFAGRQVAIVAPTTVLARQHLQSFRRRFQDLGLRIEQLSRLASPAEQRAVRAGLADGSIDIVIGTQAVAAASVCFARLGLVVVDEEQRFGARQKASLRSLTGGLHALALTATPIPRTLQGALVGLQDLSVIASAPRRRRPIRTSLTPAADTVLREALWREHRRGGQSFVICPRIEDIAPFAARLAEAVPELSVMVAHGGLSAAAMDEAMLRFAGGEADVLLATDIVETGLDVPRANTMLVWHAERFGLAQLHQLRGRVGRGAGAGRITLLTDPGASLTASARRRLETLATLDRVGAGFAIAARDLDQRGAGDLLGEDQAGHIRLIGLELYQHLLERALAEARGRTMPDEWSPAVTLTLDACLPAEYIADEAERVAVYTRLGEALRQGAPGAVTTLRAELADRFGALPEPVANLMAVARLRARCRRLGVAALDIGPRAVAARLHGRAAEVPPPLTLRHGRVLLERASPTAEAGLAAAEALLRALSRSAHPAAAE